MVQAFEILNVFASMYFCVPQKQKGVADAMIKADYGLDHRVGHFRPLRIMV